MGQLDNITVIITGAAQGIGAAYARGLAAEGCNVIVNDVLDPAPLVSEIKAAGGEARGIVADVTNDTGAQSVRELSFALVPPEAPSAVVPSPPVTPSASLSLCTCFIRGETEGLLPADDDIAVASSEDYLRAVYPELFCPDVHTFVAAATASASPSSAVFTPAVLTTVTVPNLQIRKAPPAQASDEEYLLTEINGVRIRGSSSAAVSEWTLNHNAATLPPDFGRSTR